MSILNAWCSTIANGVGNSASGCGNTVSSAYNYAGIFGYNVAAVANCAFHANNFVAQNIPNSSALLPSGAFYKTLVAGVCVVAIVP